MNKRIPSSRHISPPIKRAVTVSNTHGGGMTSGILLCSRPVVLEAIRPAQEQVRSHSANSILLLTERSVLGRHLMR